MNKGACPSHLSGGPCGRPNSLARRLATAAALAVCCTGIRRQDASLRLRTPDLRAPLVEVFPADSRPGDALKAAVFAVINRDRAAAGLFPVAWDEAASRVADAFCIAQVREASRGHFLMDGIPPYARTGFAGVFGVEAQNSVSWTTTAPRFSDPALKLAILGHEDMMAERPPADGHRRTILDPDATHVGVGYAIEGSRFQMAQEFLARGLERLSIASSESSRLTVLLRGMPLSDWRLQFVTIAWEPLPAPLSREQASARSSYSYPRASLAYIPAGSGPMRVVDILTQDKIRVWPNREFSLLFAPDRPGLYTMVFYMIVGEMSRPRPGASATLWVEGN